MPIMDHPVIGRNMKLGMVIGARNLIRRQIGKRFGPVPGWADQRIESLAFPELEELSLRILDASTLEDIFA